MNRVVHFEINADDPDKAAEFYASVFNWEITKWEGPVDYWLVTSGPDNEAGINGAIKHRSAPGLATVNTVEVPLIEEYVDKIINAGGKSITPKMEIPGIGFHIYCQDREGNVFGLLESI